MVLPSYKNIVINSSKKETIYNQLSPVKWSESPMVLTINHLEENQLEALENIDLFFEERPRKDLPYSVYILGICDEYTGQLYLASEVSKLPKFFNFKSRALNAKENNMMKKVILKRANLTNLRSSEYQPTLNSYAKNHRKISQINKEIYYFSQIKLGLEKDNGKKN
ncbi:MAG: hypothetical protein ACJAS4_002132 [Bacteriovoracaceae bacterium]|jgi:hypothetical protein